MSNDNNNSSFDTDKYIAVLEKEQEKVISYLLKHPDDYNIIESKHFTKHTLSYLYDTISELYKNGNTVSRDIIETKCKEVDPNFKSESLDEYFNPNDIAEIESNIKQYVKVVKDAYIKKEVSPKIVDLFSSIMKSGEIDHEKAQGIIESILSSSSTHADKLLCVQQLTEIYRNILKERATGKNKRTLGYRNIDSIVTRPGAAGEMTGILGDKGSGKSLLLKCMENILINIGICVLSINLEMTLESNFDRLISIRENIPLENLLYPDKNEDELNERIHRAIDSIEELDNYLYYDKSSITLSELDEMMREAKKIFKEKSVLPEDEYFITTIDLLTMIREISKAAHNPGSLEDPVNRVHEINRKHNGHLIYVIQANENKIRSGRVPTTEESCDSFRYRKEDVKNGSVYAERSRLLLSITRPLKLKKDYLIDHPKKDMWFLEPDVMIVFIAKQNDETNLPCRECAFIFSPHSFQLLPYKWPQDREDEHEEIETITNEMENKVQEESNKPKRRRKQ